MTNEYRITIVVFVKADSAKEAVKRVDKAAVCLNNSLRYCLAPNGEAAVIHTSDFGGDE